MKISITEEFWHLKIFIQPSICDRIVPECANVNKRLAEMFVVKHQELLQDEIYWNKA